MGAVPKPPQGHFNVLYFASASSFTSKEYDTFPAPLSISKLFDALEEKHSGIKDKILSSCLVTVNLNYVDVPSTDDEIVLEQAVVIKEGDEVAIIPPSGCRKQPLQSWIAQHRKRCSSSAVLRAKNDSLGLVAQEETVEAIAQSPAHQQQPPTSMRRRAGLRVALI
ncbi:hypothetical protein NUW58_g7216 [Xylaria curta]|uniref:Uncharacterized protein n=1 Tax=Xylaria curta TaxID=42375 RepID=A0ACC1NJ74_9PEZI|nr:hypothetical protein NUW58_g7216 [Xylaria curta]